MQHSSRHLGPASVTAISVGAMLGSGIFVLPGIAAAHVGPLLVLAYVVAACIVLPAALSKIELATAMPVSGGTYVYADRAFGPWMGTVVGLGTWLALCAKTAFALVGLGAYLSICADVPQMPFVYGVLALLLAVNAAGAGKAAKAQMAVVAVTLVSLVGFVGVAAPVVTLPALELPHGLHGVLEGAGMVFVAYNGVTKVCSVAGEVREPSRTLPLAMLSALAMVTVLYGLIAVVVTGVLPWDSLATNVTPIATAAEAVAGPMGGRVMAAVAVAGLVSMSNAGLMAASRFPLAMSKDDLLPQSLGSVVETTGAPLASLALTGGVMVLLVTFFPVAKLAKLASGFTIFVFSVVNAAVVLLRLSGPDWYRPTFRTPLYPAPQFIGVFGGAVLLWSLGSLAMSGVLAGVVLGSAWYVLYGQRRTTRQGELQKLLARMP